MIFNLRVKAREGEKDVGVVWREVEREEDVLGRRCVVARPLFMVKI